MVSVVSGYVLKWGCYGQNCPTPRFTDVTMFGDTAFIEGIKAAGGHKGGALI